MFVLLILDLFLNSDGKSDDESGCVCIWSSIDGDHQRSKSAG